MTGKTDRSFFARSRATQRTLWHDESRNVRLIPPTMPKLTKPEVLDRTFAMLVREWNLSEVPFANDSLRDPPPDGLGKNDHSIRALKNPIEKNYFVKQGVQVDGDDLVDAETVADLRDVIWEGQA